MDIDVVEELRQPEYTGENRCEPCTILNLGLAAVVGSLIARRSRVGGLVAVGISLVLIYLRGYLVPGTPTLTKRSLPPEVLRWFGKDPDPEIAHGFGGETASSSAPETSTAANETARSTDEASTDETPADETAANETSTDETHETVAGDTHEGATDDASAAEPVSDLETYFLDHGILEPCADRDDLCLTDDFERAWFDEIDALEGAALDAATAIEAFGFDADPEAFSLESREDVVLLRSNRGAAGRWPSQAALLADIAASNTLETWVDWDALDSEARGRLCNALRMFLETCPTGGDVHMGETVVESCCASYDVIAVTCEETGERLFEQRANAVDR